MSGGYLGKSKSHGDLVSDIVAYMQVYAILANN